MVRAMSDNHLLLIDASGFAHRAFFANAARYRKDGLPIWATLGFMGMVWAMLKRAEADKPTHAAAVFDAPGKTFRHKRFPDYKANRPVSRRLELIPQLPFMRHAAMAMGMAAVEKEGFEADDVIATLANKAARKGIRTTIVSSDKDFCQLVRDGVIEIIDPLNRTRILAAGVKARFGVAPDLVPDVQGLWGDAVDNIPGIDGIGGKMAGTLIRQFGGLEGLLTAATRSGTSFATPAIRKRLRSEADKARLSKELATLHCDVRDLPDPESLVLQKADVDHLKEMLRVLGEEKRFDVMFGGDPSTTIRLAHVPASLAWWHGTPKDGVTPLHQIPHDPQDGYFKTRLIRNGPWVPARIWRDPEVDFVTDKPTGFDIVKCEVDGRARNPLSAWLMVAKFPITKADFDHRVALSSWSKTHAPKSAEANPKEAINWNEEPL